MSSGEHRHMDRAYSMEAKAEARAQVFVKKAQAEDRPALAAMYKAAARSAQAPLRRFLMLLRGKIEPSMEGVNQAFIRETKQRLSAYGMLAREAKENGDPMASVSFKQTSQVIERQLELFQAAQAQEGPPPRYLACHICGYLAVDQAPESCPVCGAVPEKFEEV